MRDYTGLPGTLAKDLEDGDIDVFDALHAAPKAVINARALWEHRNRRKKKEENSNKVVDNPHP